VLMWVGHAIFESWRARGSNIGLWSLRSVFNGCVALLVSDSCRMVGMLGATNVGGLLDGLARTCDRGGQRRGIAAGSCGVLWDQRQLGDPMAARMARWWKGAGEAARRKLFALGGARDLVAGADRGAAGFDAGGYRRGDGQAGDPGQPYRGLALLRAPRCQL
jgi:hypothetical protein